MGNLYGQLHHRSSSCSTSRPTTIGETLQLCLALTHPSMGRFCSRGQNYTANRAVGCVLPHQVLPGTVTPLFVRMRSCGLAKASISHGGCWALKQHVACFIFVTKRYRALTRGLQPHYTPQSFTIRIFAALHLQSFSRWPGRRWQQEKGHCGREEFCFQCLHCLHQTQSHLPDFHRCPVLELSLRMGPCDIKAKLTIRKHFLKSENQFCSALVKGKIKEGLWSLSPARLLGEHRGSFNTCESEWEKSRSHYSKRRAGSQAENLLCLSWLRRYSPP